MDQSAQSFVAVLKLAWTDSSFFVKARIGFVLLLTAVASAMSALAPVQIKYVVDAFSDGSPLTRATVWQHVMTYVVLMWLGRSIGEVRGLLYARAERRLNRALSERLFWHVMSLPLRFHLNRSTGAISQVIANGLTGYQMLLQTIVYMAVPVIVELATVLVILTHFAYPGFIALFCCALAVYCAAYTYAAYNITAVARAVSETQVDASAVMTDGLLNYETVKYFGAESVVQRAVRAALVATEHGWMRFYRRHAVNRLYVACIFALFLGGAMAYGLRDVQSGLMTIGTFVLVSTYVLQIVGPLETIGDGVQNLSQGLAFLEGLLAVLEERSEGFEESAKNSRLPPTATSVAAEGYGFAAPNAKANEAGGGAELEFRNVGLSYSPGRAVLRDVSFRVGRGRVLGIVGASGAGKSTLVRLLFRLMEPDSGAILLDGSLIRNMSLVTLRSKIAVVPQDTLLFNNSLEFNITIGDPSSTNEEVERAARTARIHDFIMSSTDKYKTVVGERGIKLSGGEKQRVSIARAAIKRPTIYVFDEATSSLDSTTEADILANLRALSSQHTTLIIAHRLSSVIHADEIIVLADGVVSERGTHDALMRAKGRYQKLWAAQKGSVPPRQDEPDGSARLHD